MYRIGLTGGVGCGKSTVSSYMARLGLPIIDGDKLSREAVTPGSEAMERIRQVFGPEVFLPDGQLDRVKMAKIVFSDEDRRQALNAIIHPYVWRRTEEGLITAQNEGYPIAVMDMPLLLEIGWQLRSEAVWVVRAPVEQQILRMCARDGAPGRRPSRGYGSRCPRSIKSIMPMSSSTTAEVWKQRSSRCRKPCSRCPAGRP